MSTLDYENKKKLIKEKPYNIYLHFTSPNALFLLNFLNTTTFITKLTSHRTFY